MNRESLAGRKLWLSWAAQILAAAILGQTLYFKFSGAPEAIAIFTRLGVEPWGRIATAVLESIAVILLLSPRLAAMGGGLATCLMLGAILSHLTVLGISVDADGGLLFVLAWVVLVCSLSVLWLRRRQMPLIGARLRHTETATERRA